MNVFQIIIAERNQSTMKKLIILLLWGIPFISQSQDFNSHYDSERDYKEGLRLFNEKRYASAQYYFDRILDKEQRVGFSDIAGDAEFFAALCAIELHNKDAGARILKYIENHPGSPRITAAYFHMGRHLYRLKDYTGAAQWFDKVSRHDLTKDQLAEFFFKKGYCFFVAQNLYKAELMFYELLDMSDSEYYEPGLYYYSHIQYEKKNYQTALQGFEKLITSRAFGMLSPYYIAQIYFLQQKFEQVIEFIPKYLDKVVPARVAELNKIMGNAYFKLQNYDSALVYFEKFKQMGEGFERYDLYQLGYCYYKIGKYEEAAKNLSMVTNTPDALTQNAFYHLADCYLKINDKKNAHLAFGNAQKYEFSKEIQEDALFNYAKLTFELSFAPFAETIRTFESYLQKFPDSPRKNQVYDYLIKVYLTGKNYKEALLSLERINDKDRVLENARQRTAFFYAVELFSNQNYQEAKKYFQKAIEAQGDDIKLKAMAMYWLAETYFKLNDYNNALTLYNQFLQTPGSYNSKEYRLANYNIGYIYFLQKEYPAAIRAFSSFLIQKPESQFAVDAHLRIGDAFFAQRQFAQAIEAYQKAIENSSPQNEYATYQKGISYGLIGEQELKIQTLEYFFSNNLSIYADAAVFEMAKAYNRLNNFEKALETYLYLVYSYPNSKFNLRAQLQSGLMAYNLGKSDKALQLLKKLITEYPKSEEATEAIALLEPIYISLNDVNSYLSYMKALNIEIGANTQDSLLYFSGEKLYIEQNYEEAIKALNDYTTKFPSGQFIGQAHYFKAQSALKLNDTVLTIGALSEISKLPRNIYSVMATQQLASLQYKRGLYAEAAETYKKLQSLADNESILTEAKVGLMYCTAKLDQPNEIIKASNSVLALLGIPQTVKIEAMYNRAKAYLSINKPDSALADFKILAENTRIAHGAEARYQWAKICYQKQETEQAEKIISNFIRESTPHYYWLGQSFLLLSTIYCDRGDRFQAKAYLQSLLANYPNDSDGIKQKATEMLNQIIETENQQFQNQPKPIIINVE